MRLHARALTMKYHSMRMLTCTLRDENPGVAGLVVKPENCQLSFDMASLALDVLGTPRRETRARVFAILKQLGLQHRRDHHPLSLSGGEQQRVAIARALVNEPEILLADEPTGNLDPDLTLEIMDLVASAALRGTTVLVATHELELGARYGKRVPLGQLVGGQESERFGRKGHRSLRHRSAGGHPLPRNIDHSDGPGLVYMCQLRLRHARIMEEVPP